jgi:hypothetical protein
MAEIFLVPLSLYLSSGQQRLDPGKRRKIKIKKKEKDF